MAIYHLTAKTGSRSGGQSARAKADYIQREGKYARDMDEVLHAESGHMPEFVERPADYWDAADLYERANGRLFKEVEFALPVELTLDQQKALASEFAQHLTGAERLPYTLAIHAGGGENPHCHLMISKRINDGIERPAAQWFKRYNGKTPEKGGAQKTEALKPKAWLEQTREAWADHANRALERAGHDARIDHRTLEAQGIERLPGVHLGPNVVEMEGRGIRTDRADVALNIDTANAQIIDLQEYREAIDHERNRQSEEIQRHQRVSGADRTAAQSMATLADEARQVMSQTQQASEAQAAEWLKAQRQTGAAWVELAKELREVAAEVSSAAQSARSASRGWHWKLWLTVMLASMMPTVVLLIASLLLLDLTPLTTEDGSIWLRLVAR